MNTRITLTQEQEVAELDTLDLEESEADEESYSEEEEEEDSSWIQVYGDRTP